MLSIYLPTALLLASTACAQTLLPLAQNAIITITTSHGGAGVDLTNTTITVPLNTPFTNASALSAVSYLALTGATGVPFDTVTCQAYQDAAGTETGGNPFNSTVPALLSTNTVRVGSIVCTSTYLAAAPPGGNFSTSILATPTSRTGGGAGGGNLSSTTSDTSSSRTRSPGMTTAAPVTSVYVTTMRTTTGEPATQSTVTSVYVPPANPTGESGGQSGGQESASATASASAQLSSPNAGTRMRMVGEWGAEVYAGLAIAWMGIAYVL